MTRPWQNWLCFSGCLAVVLAALAWTSSTVLELERTSAEALRRSEVEEDVRLALWRADSWLATLIARENARPYFTYNAFYSAANPYERKFDSSESPSNLLPSPLLGKSSPHVWLHFQLSPAGEMSSPEVPQGSQRTLAEMGAVSAATIDAGAKRIEELHKLIDRNLLETLPADEPEAEPAFNLPSPPVVTANQPQRGKGANDRRSQRAQTARNTTEFNARSQNYQQLAQIQSSYVAPPSDIVETGVFRPMWLQGRLLLLRRVTVNGEVYLQGCWLNWPALRQSILAQIHDLLPAASLEAPRSEAPANRDRLLAALPLRLMPGPMPPRDAATLSPIRLSLIVAWVCVLFAAAAVAVLLSGIVALSERRAAFVSAVTHELRTPLTTFRIYTEMLSEGMVRDEADRRHYFDTLRKEADRLTHLVENVLAYARLERGRHGGHPESIQLSALLERVTPRLSDRANQAGANLRIAVDPSDSSEHAFCDISAVEQILFNLVDNACKYAAAAAQAEIQIQASTTSHAAMLHVTDNGPGISRAEGRHLFRPFSKSASQAAHSAPGVGLGLALSRRLAREMRGDLYLEAGNEGAGAAFVLRLPKHGPH